MKKFTLLIAVALLMVSCGGEIDLTDLIENCTTFCEKKAECDRSLPADYEQGCTASCERGELDNTDYNISQALIACAKYPECADFKTCVSRGGSLTDDEYGGLDGGQ